VNASRALLYVHGHVFPQGMRSLNRMTALVNDETSAFHALIREDCLDLTCSLRVPNSERDRAAFMYSLIVTALCRTRHKAVYAVRRTMPSGRVFPNFHSELPVFASA
jgi:hypothetical protein